MNPPEPGWYRDPYFKNRERYWDGENWSNECRLTQRALGLGGIEGAAGAGTATGPATVGGHEREVSPQPVTAQEPAVSQDPITTQQPAASQDPITTQQPAASQDPITTQQPAAPTPSDTQPIRIFTGGVAGVVGLNGGDVPAAAESTADGAATAAADAGGATDTTSAPPTKAEAAANAERVRTAGAAAFLGGDVADGGTTTAGAPPRTRSVRTPKEPPPEATRRVTSDADPLLGVSMPATNSATTTTATTIAIKEKAAKSRRLRLIMAVAAVVVVLAGLGIYVGLNHHSSKGGGKSHKAKNATAAAAAATTHEKTATVNISTKVSSALGQTDGPSAVGNFNLTKQEGSMAVTVPPSPTPMQVVYKKKTIYVNLGTQLSAVMPGKTWVSASVIQIGSSSPGVSTSLSGFVQMVGNPLGLLRQLKGGGATIVSLGSSTFNGTPVEGYKVTLGSKSLKKSAGLVPATHTTETVYVAKSGGKIEAIVIPTTTTSGGQLINQTVTVAFSNFGAPVTVTVPPANETVTLAQYHAALGQPSTTPTTTPPGSLTNGGSLGSLTGASSPGSG